jgi:glycosyltransferase involved in cell wall biosynthesis
MKIIFLLDVFANTEVNRFLLEEVLFLRKQDIDARVVTLLREDDSDTLYSESLFSKETFTCVPFVWWKGKDWKKLKTLIEKESPALVITSGKKADIVGNLVARHVRVPKIFVFAHDVNEIEKRNKTADNILASRTDFFIVSSEEAKKMLVAEGVFEGKIAVLRDGISFENYGVASLHDVRYGLDIPKEEFVFVFLGDLTAERGVDVLLRAFAKVPRGFLLIVGDGSEKKSLEGLSQSLGLKARVKFIQNYFDIPGILVSSNAMVFPSKKEAFAVPVVLGLSSGLPVIAADFDGVSEIIENGENGLVVRKQDSEELAKAMNTFLNDTELYVKLKGNTKKNLTKFSLSAHAAKLLALVQKK